MNEVPIFPTVIAAILLTAALQPALVWMLVNRSAQAVLPRRKQLTFSAAVAIFLTGWMFLFFTLSIDGFFDTNNQSELVAPVPNLAFAAAPVLIAILALRFWPTLRRVVEAIPMHWLILVQTLRVIGVVFLIVTWQELIPAEFGTPAGWGDIITGIAAPAAAYLWYRQATGARVRVLAWNIFGAGDLVLAIILGMLTTPGPNQALATKFQFHPLVDMAGFPLVLIPTTIVPLALILHVFGFYKLWLEGARKPFGERSVQHSEGLFPAEASVR